MQTQTAIINYYEPKFQQTKRITNTCNESTTTATEPLNRNQGLKINSSNGSL